MSRGTRPRPIFIVLCCFLSLLNSSETIPRERDKKKGKKKGKEFAVLDMKIIRVQSRRCGAQRLYELWGSSRYGED
ncbi:hypothetical protein I3842_14G043300 [Carya illinoinensis]|uniref:Secreted protein n=1 Tax=Carya illinoinensis TaxID=32201 RepID=A0A922AHM9_CARIL|nr:hypothetical protein I3842_14G043300 [Carya illinoinensis]